MFPHRFLHHTTCTFVIGALVIACSDDGSTTNADTSESDTSTEATSTDSDTSVDWTDSQSDWGTDGPTDDETDEGETDEPEPVCESEQALGDWGLMVVDGDFPNDVPEDVDESCTVISGAEGQLALDCPFAEIALILGLDPAPTLPDPGATAQVRIHHEGGWQNWPDLWVSVDVEGGDLFGLQASSVLLPLQGSYAVPWDPHEEPVGCGPFDLLDSCGPQLGKELVFAVDGEELSGWHGTHVSSTVAELEFEAWINLAREYVEPPETCDFAPSFYSVVTRRQKAK